MADYFKEHSIDYLDYKNIEVLKKFITPHGQIVGRGRSGLSALHQRRLAQAIKRARFMGLLPYVAH